MSQDNTADWATDEYEGQLAIDAFQTPDEIIIKAPIAGVSEDDLEVAVTDEMVTIKGERRNELGISRDEYFVQECYWGTFARNYIFPVAVDSNRAEASLKDGVLLIRVPKLERSRARSLKINSAS